MPFFTLKAVAHQNIEAIQMPAAFQLTQTDGQTFTGVAGDYIASDSLSGEVFGIVQAFFDATYVPSP